MLYRYRITLANVLIIQCSVVDNCTVHCKSHSTDNPEKEKVLCALSALCALWKNRRSEAKPANPGNQRRTREEIRRSSENPLLPPGEGLEQCTCSSLLVRCSAWPWHCRPYPRPPQSPFSVFSSFSGNKKPGKEVGRVTYGYPDFTGHITGSSLYLIYPIGGSNVYNNIYLQYILFSGMATMTSCTWSSRH